MDEKKDNTGVFIQNERTIYNWGSNIQYWTTDMVISEIRDESAREFYQNFPYEIKTRHIPAETIKFVSDFASESGELSFLSNTDLSVIALTCILEQETHGDANLRKHPCPSPSHEILPSSFSSSNHPSNININQKDQVMIDDESTGGIWVNSDNFKKWSLGLDNITHESIRSTVAIITTDYTMQNLILQLGLRLISIGGYEIDRVKNYLKKCHGCFKVSNDLSREFCQYCGGHTLIRICVETKSDGIKTSYSNPKSVYNLRGTIYSIPKARGGRYSQDLVLREDVMKHQKKDLKKNKEPFNLVQQIEGTFDKKKSMTSNLKYGYGKSNPNVVKRNRKKKKK